jgi:hypothetical protein
LAKRIVYDLGHAHSGLEKMHFYVAVYEESVMVDIIKDIMYLGLKPQFNEVARCWC